MKRVIKLAQTVLLCFIFMQYVRAQSSNTIAGYDNIPSSPTAASLLTAVNATEDLSTGTESVSVPITEIVEDGVSIPVNLNYVSGNGIKVGQEASNVGLGWNLICNYGIVREVRGKKDEGKDYSDWSFAIAEPNKYLGWYENPQPNIGVADLSTIQSFWEPLKSYTDTEPDLFTVNLPGLQFKFFFDENKDIQTIPANLPVTIYPYTMEVGSRRVVNKQQIFSKWIIKGPDGSKYLIGEDENGNLINEEADLVNKETAALDLYFNNISEWFLTKITTPLLSKEIKFNYLPEKYITKGLASEEGFYKGRYKNEDDFGCGQNYETCWPIDYLGTIPSLSSSDDNVRTNYYLYNSNRLQNIETENIKLNFNAYSTFSGVRSDLIPTSIDLSAMSDELKDRILSLLNIHSFTNYSASPKSIDNIEVQYAKNGTFYCFKKYLLNTSYSGNLWNTENTRLILNSVSETTCDEDEALSLTTSFEYHLNGFGIDDANITLPSKLSYAQDFWGNFNGKHSNNSLIASSTNSNGIKKVSYLADRRASFPETQYGILKKINYPTGGVISFDYELNEAKVSNHQSVEVDNDIYNNVNLCNNATNCCTALPPIMVEQGPDGLESITYNNVLYHHQLSSYFTAYNVNLTSTGNQNGVIDFNQFGNSSCTNIIKPLFIVIEKNGVIELDENDLIRPLSYSSTPARLTFDNLGINSAGTYKIWINRKEDTNVNIYTYNNVNSNTIKGAGLRIASKMVSDGDNDNADTQTFIYDYNFKSIPDEINNVKECQGIFIKNPFPLTTQFDTDGPAPGGTGCDNLDLFNLPKVVGKNCWGCCGEVLGAIPVSNITYSSSSHSLSNFLHFNILYKQVKVSQANVDGFGVSEFIVPNAPDNLSRYQPNNNGFGTYHTVNLSESDECISYYQTGTFQKLGYLKSEKEFDNQFNCVKSSTYNFKNLVQNLTTPSMKGSNLSIYGNIQHTGQNDYDFSGLLTINKVALDSYDFLINNYVLDNVVKEQDKITTTTTYKYHDSSLVLNGVKVLNQPIEITTTISGSDDVFKEEISYPYTVSLNSSDPNYLAILKMKLQHMLVFPLAREKKYNDVLYEGSKIDFKVRLGDYVTQQGQTVSVDGQIVPEHIYKVQNGAFVFAARVTDWNENGTPLNNYKAYNATLPADTDVSDDTKYFPFPDEYVYYPDGRLQTRKVADREVNFEYYDNGLLFKETDANGIFKTYEYDGLNRLSIGYESNGKLKTEYTYNYLLDGMPMNSVTETVSFPQDASIPNQVVKEVFDGLNRPIKKIVKGFKEDGSDLETHQKVYDHAGRLSTQSKAGEGSVTYHYEKFLSGRLILSETNLGNSTSIYGTNTEAITEPLSGKVHNPGTLIMQSMTDVDGKERLEYKDLLGKTIRISEEKSNNNYIHTTNGYNEKQQLLAVQPPAGEQYLYTYDNNGFLASKYTPGAKVAEQYGYDKLGRNVLLISPTGENHVTVFDKYNRIIRAGLYESTLPNDEYFGVGPYQWLNPTKILKLNIYAGDNYEKDWIRVERERIIGGDETMYETEYFHDEIGRQYEIIKHNHLGGIDTINNLINDAGLIQSFSQTHSISDGNGNYTEPIKFDWQYHYDEHNRKTGISFENQKIVHYDFNDYGKLVSKKLHETNTNTYLQNIDYLYDGNGRLTDINDIEAQSEINCNAQRLCKRSVTFDTFNNPYIYNFVLNDAGEEIYLEPDQNSFGLLDTDIDAYETLLETQFLNEGYIFDEIEISWVDGILQQSFLVTIDFIQSNIPLIKINTQGSNDVQTDYFQTTNCCGLTENFDLFAQHIDYNGSLINFNEWQTVCSNVHSYNYHYDGLSRLSYANYSYRENYNDTSVGDDSRLPIQQIGRYSTKYTYDDLGNIQSLYRRGVTTQNGGNYTYGVIDELTYNYVSNGSVTNRLTSVYDFSNSTSGFNGNVNSNHLISNYQYDDAGNLISDSGKGITVTNNHINKPSTISTANGSLDFIYNTDGSLLRKHFADNGDNTVRIKDIIGNIEYIDGKISSILHKDGKIKIDRPDLTADYYKPNFQYSISDYQGNPMVWFEDVNNDKIVIKEEIIQEKNYYPLGLAMDGDFEETQGIEDTRQFSTMELIKELDVYTTNHRVLDPAIGRWWQVDPKADNFKSQSPYNFAGCNPVMLSDPNGDSVILALSIISTFVSTVKFFQTLDQIQEDSSRFVNKGKKNLYIAINIAMLAWSYVSLGATDVLGQPLLAAAIGKGAINNFALQAVISGVRSVALPYMAARAFAASEFEVPNKKNLRKNHKGQLLTYFISWGIDMVMLGFAYKKIGMNLMSGKVDLSKANPKALAAIKDSWDGISVNIDGTTSGVSLNMVSGEGIGVAKLPKFLIGNTAYYTISTAATGISVAWQIRNLPVFSVTSTYNPGDPGTEYGQNPYYTYEYANGFNDPVLYWAFKGIKNWLGN